jgi:hypothetical protein
MLPGRRSQPYRQGSATREAGLALQAMLRGGMENAPPQAERQQSTLEALLEQYSQHPRHTQATADVRGNFAQPGAPQDMHTLLMEQLKRRRQAVAVPRGEF